MWFRRNKKKLNIIQLDELKHHAIIMQGEHIRFSGRLINVSYLNGFRSGTEVQLTFVDSTYFMKDIRQ